MNYTKNHHLPQWVESDRILMKDFNDAMSNIESGLSSAAQAASVAQATAQEAKATAQEAKTAGALPYIIGYYIGDGASQTIYLPFEPSLVIVSGMTESTNPSSAAHSRYFAITGWNTNVRRRIQLAGDGFNVYPDGNDGQYTPSLNEPGRRYDYIAFR